MNFRATIKLLFGILSICILASCGQFDLELFHSVQTAAVPSGGGGGGACSVVITPDFFQSNNTTTSFDGTTFTHTATANPAGEGAGVDTAHPSANTTGITYFEITYTGSTVATGVQVGTIFLRSDFGANAVVRIRPATGEIVDNLGNTLVSGLTINPGYVLGYWINHDTGDVFYKDNFGNTGLVENNLGLVGVSIITGQAGTPADVIGATIKGTLNVGNSAFALTPPVGAEDWCGNSL